MSAELLALFVAVPLLAAGVVVPLGGHSRISRGVLVAVLLADLAAAGYLVAQLTDGGVIAHPIGLWPAGIAIPFAADMLTSLMLTLTAFLTLVSVWFAGASRQWSIRFFAPLVLVLTAGVNGALLTADLFNLFVFIEVMLLPSYALIILAQRGQGRLMQVSSSRIYVTVNLLTSTILLIGVGLVYGVTGTVNIAELAGAAQESTTVAIAMAVVLLALSIKAAVLPVHGWLVRTYPFMSPAVTAMFSALHTKVAIYAIYRVYAVIFDGEPAYLWIGVLVFTATMVAGVLGAVGEHDARSILSFHMVSQIGYILLGVALFTPLGLAAGIFYLLHHMVVKASLFLSTGAVEVAYGRHPLGTITGLLQRERATGFVFFAAALSLAGIPPLSGFIAKLTLILAAFEAGQVAAAAVAVAVSLLTLLSMLKIWRGTFLGELGDTRPEVAERIGEAHRIRPALIAPAGALALVTLSLGLGGELLFGLTEVAADNLLNTMPYVEAVLG